MKTETLIEALARGPIAVAPNAVERSVAGALGCGALLAIAAMLAVLGLRTDLRVAIEAPMFWAKLAYPLVLALLAAFATTTLARPTGGSRAPMWATGMAMAAMVLVALGMLATTPADARLALALGHSAATCVIDVLVLALPTFVLALWALRACAPTRPHAAGAAAGLLAGATAAAAYAWHCDEMALPFLGLWYTLGMALPMAIGAAMGPRVLRWA
jgi:hypothetical protein